MFCIEHASSTGPAVMEEGRRGGKQQASCLVVKQAVYFPQVLASFPQSINSRGYSMYREINCIIIHVLASDLKLPSDTVKPRLSE